MTGVVQPQPDEIEIALSRAVIERLCRMLHTLINHHTGYPELYSPLLALMKNHVRLLT